MILRVSRRTRHVSFWSIAVCLLVPGLLVPSLCADVVINEVLASNRDINADEFGSSSDWFELTNNGADSVDLGGFWVSDDPELPQKWQFPSVTLAPGEHRVVWCSGRNEIRATTELINDPTTEMNFRPTVVTLDAEWRYFTQVPGDPAPPEGWYQSGFDDSGWASGKPGFGYGEEGLQTEFSSDVKMALFRHVFHIDDPDNFQDLIFRARYDDGLLVYLNGVRIVDAFYGREEDPVVARNATTSHEATRPERFDISHHSGLLRAGGNLIAIALLNRSRRSDDLRLDPEVGFVDGILHTNFKLNAQGDGVFLSDSSGQLIDAVIFPAQVPDRSFGRYPDASGDFFFMLLPTPTGPNNDFTSSEKIGNEIVFSPDGGVHSAPFDVTLHADIPFDAFEIRSEISGGEPTELSSLYEAPITLTRDRVIRAAGFLNGRQVTPVVTRSFFGGTLAQNLELPIISISMDRDEFHKMHVQGGIREAEGYFEVYDVRGQRGAGVGVGLRLHGGAGRQGDFRTKKSYRAYFRGRYGDKRLKYPIIPDTDVKSFDKLVLRGNFNDSFRAGSNSSLIRDQLIRDLHEEMGGIISHGSWYHIFVNAEYRGLYNIVERMDRKFFESYFPEDGENWDVVKTHNTLLDGTIADWNNLLRTLLTTRIDDEAKLEEIGKRLDIDRFTDYMVLNMWTQNHDWPQNNWYAARPQRADGRWFFLCWDAEFGLGLNPSGFSADSFSHVTSQAGQPNSPAATVFGALLGNRHFQELVLERISQHIDGVLSRENVTAHIERLAAVVRPDIDAEARVARGSRVRWESVLRAMTTFAAKRGPSFVRLTLRNRRLTLPVVVSIDPARVTLRGPVELSFRMRRATEATRVFFNDIPAEKLVLESSHRLVVTMPFDRRLEGNPTIKITDPDLGLSSRSDLLIVVLPDDPPFVRADADGNGRVTISDALAILRHVVVGAGDPACAAALDADGSEVINLSDAIFLLNHLFRAQSPPPPAPFPECGLSESPDAALSCGGSAACQ